MTRGIFVTQGLDLRIRGLKIDIEKGEVTHEAVELRVDVWDHWLLIGRLATAKAEEAQTSVMEAHHADDAASLGRALEEEFRQSMIAATSIAFAFDAFYAGIKSRIPPHPDEQHWQKNRLARYARIGEVLNRTWKIKPENLKPIREYLSQLFRWRDWGVHPPSAFRAPAYREDIERHVDWRFAAYRAENARTLLRLGSELIGALIREADRTPDALGDWLKASEGRLLAATGQTPS